MIIRTLFLQGQEQELGELLKFEYAPVLVFDNENEVRQLIQKKEASDDSIKWGQLFRKVEGKTPNCSIRWLGDEVGYGLFAEEPIPQGACLGEYTGKVRKKDIYDGTNNYLYRYPLEDSDVSLVIDAKPMGNHTRFINHSYTPNLKPYNAYHNGLYHKILVAERAIERGEQLTYSYGSSYWYIRSPPMNF